MDDNLSTVIDVFKKQQAELSEAYATIERLQAQVQQQEEKLTAIADLVNDTTTTMPAKKTAIASVPSRESDGLKVTINYAWDKGEALRQWVMDKGYILKKGNQIVCNQTAFAADLGVSSSAVCKWMNNIHAPSSMWMAKLKIMGFHIK